MKLLFCLDYDGTLTPIVDKPSLAKLSKAQKEILRKLARSRGVIIAIISGRRLADVKHLVGLANIYYAGNHGLEIIGPELKKIHPKARQAIPALQKILNKLQRELTGIKGVLWEDKKFSLSLHYRLAKPRDWPRLKEALKQTVKPFLNKVCITHGKMVLEVRPKVKWDKGLAVLWLLKKLSRGRQITPIYIGDDQTDEDAFRALKSKGITVKVGRTAKTLAQYRVKDVSEVYKFIQSMLQLKTR